MNLNVVRIGNSKGIRIPKKILEECHITNIVNLRVKGTRIILESIPNKARKGWMEAAQMAHAAGDDKLLFPDRLGDTIFIVSLDSVHIRPFDIALGLGYS